MTGPKLYLIRQGHPLWDDVSRLRGIAPGERGLYEKYGFEKIGEHRTTYGTTDQLFRRTLRAGNAHDTQG